MLFEWRAIQTSKPAAGGRMPLKTSLYQVIGRSDPGGSIYRDVSRRLPVTLPISDSGPLADAGQLPLLLEPPPLLLVVSAAPGPMAALDGATAGPVTLNVAIDASCSFIHLAHPARNGLELSERNAGPNQRSQRD